MARRTLSVDDVLLMTGYGTPRVVAYIYKYGGEGKKLRAYEIEQATGYNRRTIAAALEQGKVLGFIHSVREKQSDFYAPGPAPEQKPEDEICAPDAQTADNDSYLCTSHTNSDDSSEDLRTGYTKLSDGFEHGVHKTDSGQIESVHRVHNSSVVSRAQAVSPRFSEIPEAESIHAVRGEREDHTSCGATDVARPVFALVGAEPVTAKAPPKRRTRKQPETQSSEARAIYADVFRINPLAEFLPEFEEQLARLGPEAFRARLVDCKGRAFNPKNNVNVLEALKNGFRSGTPRTTATAPTGTDSWREQNRGRFVN